MTTDRAQIARLGLDKNRQKLNAFMEELYPNTAHTHDDDAFIVPVCYNIQLHLLATAERVEIWGMVCGSTILPTAPAQMNPTLLERCAEVIADGLSLVHQPMLTSLPAWAVEPVRREFHRRCELFASYAETAEVMPLQDALRRVELEMQRRGQVAPEYVIPALMEAGLGCAWVKDRPPSQRAYVGHAPELRALQDAMHRVGAVPYRRLDYCMVLGQSHTLSLGGEVIATEDEGLILALYGFTLEPSLVTFDVLRGALAKLTDPTKVIGAGPVAAWVRAQVQK